jgi:hypothetical protein
MDYSITTLLSDAFIEVWAAFMTFLPMIIAALLIVTVGVIAGKFLGETVTKLLNVLKVNDALGSVGGQRLAEKAGVKLAVHEWIGTCIRWFIQVVFFIAALNALGMYTVTYFMEDMVYGFLPKVLVAVFIMVAAGVAGEWVRKAIERSVTKIGSVSPALLGAAAEWSIIVFALFAALTELGIAEDLIRILFTGIVVALSLALGLSFGIGGQQAAADFIESVKEKGKK